MKSLFFHFCMSCAITCCIWGVAHLILYVFQYEIIHPGYAAIITGILLAVSMLCRFEITHEISEELDAEENQETKE